MCAVYFGRIIVRLIPPSRFNERGSVLVRALTCFIIL